jgi:DNA (cytosine-5)-methyltransferase 1
MRRNKARKLRFIRDWSIFEDDVRRFPFTLFPAEPMLLSGGVPCQPFSLGGKHKGHLDDRNMFPAFIDVVRTLAPKAILIENVKGLLRESFAPYFQYVLLQLRHPEVLQQQDEDWKPHLARLEEVETSGSRGGLHYNVVYQLVDAADYGVPQRRERVFIVGLRADLGLEWSFPTPTHSKAALEFDQGPLGNYWERHCLAPRVADAQAVPVLAPDHLPWVTVRDVTSDLPEFGSPEGTALEHVLWPGARPYVGHTGSPLDAPSKALKVGDHGVPGGENMVVLDDGSVRYMSVREAARVQTFPDDFVFGGSWTEGLQQLGNAVPVELAEQLAGGLAHVLRSASRTDLERHPSSSDRASLQSA